MSQFIKYSVFNFLLLGLNITCILYICTSKPTCLTHHILFLSSPCKLANIWLHISNYYLYHLLIELLDSSTWLFSISRNPGRSQSLPTLWYAQIQYPIGLRALQWYLPQHYVEGRRVETHTCIPNKTCSLKHQSTKSNHTVSCMQATYIHIKY